MFGLYLNNKGMYPPDLFCAALYTSIAFRQAYIHPKPSRSWISMVRCFLPWPLPTLHQPSLIHISTPTHRFEAISISISSLDSRLQKDVICFPTCVQLLELHLCHCQHTKIGPSATCLPPYLGNPCMDLCDLCVYL